MSKPGWKSTEFWFSVVAFLVGAVLASGAVDDGQTLKILGYVSSTLATLGYTASRGFAKASEAKAAAFASVAAANPTEG